MNSKKLFWLAGPITWIAYTKKVSPKPPFIKYKGPNMKETEEFAGKLLTIAGESVVVPYADEELCALFVKKAKPTMYKKKKLTRTNIRNCHESVSRLWLKKPEVYTIYTGYALSADDVWRRHSWILTKEKILIEPTEKREMYMGIKLSPHRAKQFAKVYTEDEDDF